MTLSFSTKINGKPNYFIPKIWMGLPEHHKDKTIYERFYDNHVYKFHKPWDIPDSLIKPKLHTIREDASFRWKAGNDIHMVINNRTMNRFQFAPVVKCVSVQEIKITEKIITVHDCVKLKDGRVFTVQVDGKYLPLYRITELAWNDGFDSVEDFFKYFNTDFKGKLIHWTDIRY